MLFYFIKLYVVIVSEQALAQIFNVPHQHTNIHILLEYIKLITIKFSPKIGVIHSFLMAKVMGKKGFKNLKLFHEKQIQNL